MASLKDELAGMNKSVQNLIQQIAGASRTLQAGSKNGRIDTGSNFLNNALGSFSQNPFQRAEAQFGLGMSMVQGAGQMAQGIGQMMPNVSATMERMTTYYNASLRATNGMSRNQLQQATLRTMQGAITSPGSDAMVAGYLTMRGMVASAEFGSTYQQTVRGVAGAAKYLNMSNERAAAAIEGLTSAQGASSMLRNFGIFTADVRTGQEKNPTQIFGELYGRMTAGRGKVSEEQVLESYRRGALGANLRASGMSEDQQQMFVAYAMERARGRELDLSNEESVKKAMEAAGFNPNQPGYNLNTAKTNAMQSAQEQYLAGIKMVTPVLEGLTTVGGLLAGTFGFLNAAAATAASSLAAVGAGNVLAGAGKAGAAGMMITGGMGKGGGKGGIKGAATNYVSNVKAGAKSNLGAGLKVGGVVGAISAVTQLPGVIEEANAGRGGAAIGGLAGSTIGGLAGAAIGQALIPIPVVGALIGGTIGSMAGGAIGEGIGSMFDQGEGGGSDGQGAGQQGTATGQNEPFWLQHPTKSAKIGARYGATHSVYTGKLVWPNGHKGIDYEGSSGDLIHAAAPGIATVEEGGELGLRVKIKHDNGKYTFYCHLSGVDVRSNQAVQRGQVVGRMGNTGGKSNGVHLHFALSKTNTTGGHENPEPYLRGSANYMDPAPANQDQSASGNTPSPNGASGTDAARGGEDSSATSNTTSASQLNGTAGTTSIDAPGASGASVADTVEPWSASSVGGSGNTGPAAGGGEGGEGANINQTDYLATPPGLKSGKKPGQSGATSVTNNNVTINLSIAKGTPEEARRFAHMLKQALEEENAMRMMARN